MHVSQVAKKLDVSSDTIRYYSRIGLLKPALADNGYKNFSEKDIRRLRFALRAKQLGFSLADIKTLVDISDHGEAPCPKAREIISKNLDELGESIEESLKLFRRIQQAIQKWNEMPDKEPDGETICALIDNWEETDIS